MTTSRFRPDIDGLRAVAVVLVVAYHAGLGGFSGGYVGVDVFFVISGFLITRNLLGEIDETGRVDLPRFWARRLRRLIPALALMLGVTLVIGFLVLETNAMVDLIDDTRAAAFQVSNFDFANDATTYFRQDSAPSPLLHTWSLGVEEQFYLVWPLALAAVALAGSRGSAQASDSAGRTRRMLIAVLVIATATSLVLSLALTTSGSPWAFYGLPSRIWEFGIAGLLAVAIDSLPQLNRSVSAGLAATGLALIGAATVTFSDFDPYPGWRAAVPVVGTVLCIVAGHSAEENDSPNPVARLLGLGPVQWVGRISYSWYLWHWPAMVLYVTWRGYDSSRTRSVSGFASIVVAAAAHHLWENRFRHQPKLVASHGASAGVAVAMSLAVLGGTAAMGQATAPGDAQEARRRIAADPAVWVEPAELAASPDAAIEDQLTAALDLFRTRVEFQCPDVRSIKSPAGDQFCPGGEPNGDRSLLVIGDSHAGQWHRVFERVASQSGLTLYYRQHSGCSPYRLEIRAPRHDAARGEFCREMHEGNLRLLDHLEPDAVIIATLTGTLVDADDPDAFAESWRMGVDHFRAELAERGIAHGVILDEPVRPRTPTECLASAQDFLSDCAHERHQLLATGSGALLEVERAIYEASDIAHLDMTDQVCHSATCPPVIDGQLVYVDRHHLTDAFAVTLASEVTDLVERTLAPS